MLPRLLAVLALLLVVVGCSTATPAAAPSETESQTPLATAPQSSGSSNAEQPERLSVVTTTNIVADWVNEVGGDRIDVFSMLPAGADPHSFQPGARDVAQVADADLVLSVGLTLEAAWLQELIENASSDPSKVAALGEVVEPNEFMELGIHDEHDEHGHGEHEDEDVVNKLNDIVHEAEEGELSPEEALEEIEELLGGHEHDEDGHEDEEQHEGEDEEAELQEEVEEIIHEAEEGAMTAEDAIEAIETAVEQHLGTNLGKELNELIHHAEEEGEEAEHILEDLEAAIHEHEGHDHEDEHEGHEHEEDKDLEEKVLGIIHEAEEGTMTAQDAIEAIEQFIGHDEEAHEDGDEHGHEAEDDDEHDHAHGQFDPHFWFDPIRVKLAVNDIASRLSMLDPAGSDMYSENARAYTARLDELHEWIQQQVSQIPQERRLLVTSHDSFGYFAQAYGFKVVGAVIPGLTTERDPSPQEIAKLVGEIQEHDVPAIFTEASVSGRMAQRVAEEADVSVVTELNTGSLGGQGSGSENYIDFMRANVLAIVGALK